MKRSEVVLMIAEALGQLPAPAYPVAEEVLSRLEGPLSIDYEPEEEPLPEQLVGCRPDPPYHQGAIGLPASSRLVLVIPSTWTSKVGLRAAQAVAREAVRRWNAWPELRAIADCLGNDGPPHSLLSPQDANRRRILLAILDSKE